MSIHVSIGSDHAGFELKEALIAFMKAGDFTVSDKGCFSAERADYPDFAHLVAREVLERKCDFGVLICGSGNGIAMTANKHKGIRAALCWNEEIAVLARQHNDANIMVLPARYISTEEARKCLKRFAAEKFEGGRHAARIQKIDV